MGEYPNRFLIVSLGSIGRRHLRNLRLLNPAANIAVLRTSENPQPQPPEGADLIVYNIDDALDFKPQAAIIASPATMHADIATELAARGVHLLIEKPLAADLSSANAISRAAADAGIVCMVGYNLRFKQSLLKVRELLNAGMVGAIMSVRAEVGQYLPTWRPGTDYRHSVSAQSSLGGGALLELSHEIDYLLWMFGLPDKVHCNMGRYSDLDLDVEDLVNLTMEYESPKRMINVHLDFLQQPARRRCRLIGINGTIEWDALADRITLTGIPETEEAQELDFSPSDGNQTYLDEIRHFTTAIANNERPEPSLQSGVDVMRVIDAARRSAASGATVPLERP
ncbi:MAG: Gfo/Idh/MocA family oxidoreductase [Sphingorhabdus sp.]|nr:Gfo/Idh/MocA family oxidoreductase [Sphingorhabdus sp.]